MDRAEFDKFADEYKALHVANIRLSGESPEYFAEYKIRDLRERTALPADRLRQARVLDFGAGVGASAAHFQTYCPESRVTCVDVSMKSLEIAAARFGQSADFVAFDGRRLPFADDTFDVAFSACVFHHIAAAEHPGLLAEMRRVMRRDGQLMIFEHNPLNPLTVHAVNTCSFDENAVLILGRAMKQRLARAGFRDAEVKYRVFFPRVLKWLRPLENFLGWLPLGAQYYVLAKK
jgi:ubiquinone/menaquinone biosynthesis C-methylase UbiE